MYISKMTLKITAMEQKRYIEEEDESPLTKIFNFLVFIGYIPIRYSSYLPSI